jgi:hypothetical protein
MVTLAPGVVGVLRNGNDRAAGDMNALPIYENNNMPYWQPNPPQPPYLKGWRDLSLEQVEDATSDIEIGQDPRFGCGALRAVRVGKPWRLGLPDCYVERLDALKHHYYALSDMRADLVSIREGLSSSEAGHLTLKHPTLSGLSEDITTAIALLECAEDKMFNLLPREEFASPT